MLQTLQMLQDYWFNPSRIRPWWPGFSCLMFPASYCSTSLQELYLSSVLNLGFSVFWCTKYDHAHTFDWQHAPKCTSKERTKAVLPTKIRKTGLFVKTSKTVIFSMVYFVRIKYVISSTISYFNRNQFVMLIGSLSQPIRSVICKIRSSNRLTDR